MKKLSKLMSLVLALAMCLSLLPATALAAVSGSGQYGNVVTDENTLANCLSAQGSATINLGTGITVDDVEDVTVGGDHALDGQNYKLSVMLPASGGWCKIPAGKSLAVSNLSIGSESGGPMFNVMGTLLLENFKLPGTYTIQVNGGTMTIEASTIEGTIQNDGGSVVINDGFFDTDSEIQLTNNASMTINSGKFDGAITVQNSSVTINGGIFNGDISGNVTINGGTFANKPDTNWIAEGYKAVWNGDSWRVEPNEDDEDDPTPTPGGDTTNVVASYTVSLTKDNSDAIGRNSDVEFKLNIEGQYADGTSAGNQFYGAVGIKVTFTGVTFKEASGENSSWASGGDGTVTITVPNRMNPWTSDDLPTLVFTVPSDAATDWSGSVALSTDDAKITSPDFDPDIVSPVASSDTIDLAITDTVKVTFNAGEYGTVDVEAIEVVRGGSVTAPTPTIKDEHNGHYSFDKWVTEEGGEVAAIFDPVDGDMTVYAAYTADKIDLPEDDKKLDPDAPDPTDPIDPGYKDEEPSDGPHYKEDYTIKVAPYLPDQYTYEVKYTNTDTGANEETATDNNNGTFTIPGEHVTESLTISITATPIGELSVSAYSSGVALVKLTREKLTSSGYQYDGHDMFYSNGAYVYLVKISDDYTVDDVQMGAATKVKYSSTANCESVEAQKDINGDKQDNALYDLACIAEIYRGAPLFIGRIEAHNANMMKLYLRADLTKDGKVDSSDFAEWQK